MNIVAFEQAHVGLMRVQPWQMGEVDASSLAAPYGMAWTALADGEVIACAGLVEMWRGRACAWGLLSADAGRHMTALTREIRSRLDGVAFRRIEIAVAAGSSLAGGGRGCWGSRSRDTRERTCQGDVMQFYLRG